jgi:hypothetical protein
MRRVILFALLVLLAAASSSATNAPTNVQRTQSPENGAIDTLAPSPAATNREMNAAMMDEINARIAAQQERVDALTQKAQAAPPTERLAILKEINESGAQLMLDIWRIQARYARLEGRTELAERIEAQIELRVRAQTDPSSRILPAQMSKIERQPSTTPEVRAAVPAQTTGEAGIGAQGGERR